ncbi:MAG: putative PEP-binding protein [Cylindrospermopsis raciborskii 1523720]|uniref:putative PEP-binding protein n=1 Tax=Cylindrospermopsis raciborskii TaxID=77022 RepID=UPI002B479B67|nr:putative PEP-binding protein [Cylindrospermopsis raciborskii]MEB3147119.1 putative PEP-binding protein [Cylindrospermopsis raciborskii]
MENLYWLEKINPEDCPLVGDKAFYLSKIFQKGYPVVPGFVLSASLWREFVVNLTSSESLVADLPNSSLHLDVNNWRQLQQVASRLRQEVIGASLPSSWISQIYQAGRDLTDNCLILRPSLSISSANYLVGNISGLFKPIFCAVNEQSIANGLKQTWRQIFGARSILYWHSVGVSLQHINLALLVQPVENAIASGSTKFHTSGLEVEATYGLGMAITKGEVLPDVYYINHNTGGIEEKHLGNKVLAYSVDESKATTNDNCLFSYTVSQEQQKQYALPDEFLEEIITLGNQLVRELGRKLTIKWTITANSPKLYITQVNVPRSVTPHLLLKGIGAAKGKINASAYVIGNIQPKPSQIPKDVILVAPTITTEWFPILHNVMGIITEKGGLTSHGAILSRELGIPAIVNARNATNIIQTGERILLDGDRGEVYYSSGSEDSLRDGEKIPQRDHEDPDFSHEKSDVHDGFSNHRILPMIGTKLLVNLSQPNLIEKVRNLPVDGVGLLRSELMLLNILHGENPYNWIANGRETELLDRLSKQIQEFVQAFTPRPIFYRSLDWYHQDLSSYHGRENPPASILGEHGTASYLKNPGVFELELKALARLQKDGYSNIYLMLPFVRTVEEFIFCQRKVVEFGLTENPQFQLWIMAEVPSVLFLLPEYIKSGVRGISIGTNDLTQLILGVDRETGDLSPLLNQRHPAVMGTISQLIKMAQAGGISCSICGQAPVLYPEIIDQLIQWGIDSISVEPEAVERTYHTIASAEQRLILAAARKQLES